LNLILNYAQNLIVSMVCIYKVSQKLKISLHYKIEVY